MAGHAKRRGVFVFWQDKVGIGGVVGLVARETSDGRGVLAKGSIGAEIGCPSTG